MNKLLIALLFVLLGAPALAQSKLPPLPLPPVVPAPTVAPHPNAAPLAPVAPVSLAGPTALAAPVAPGGAPVQQPGLYVQVLDGMVALSNPAGVQVFQAGQFGFTPNFQTPPVILPQNPGLKFSPPPVFNTSTGTPPTASSAGKANAVDCEVR